MQIIELAIFLIMFMSIVSIGSVYGQNYGGISAATNKASYQPGDKVVITGSVSKSVYLSPATIIVRNPLGNVYEVGQVRLMNNIFVHDFVISDDSQSGLYTVNLKYGDKTAEIQFMVNVGHLQIIPVFDNMIKTRGDNATIIKYGNVAVSTVDDSITISVDASKISKGSATVEYQIPKKVIDTPGGQLIVKENGNQVDCTQTETDVERILDCPIQTGTKQLMFIGTVVIPEFGPMSIVILTIGALVSLIVFSRYNIK